MNKSITRITLDVSPRANRPCIYVKQFDTFRRFVFSLVDKGLPYVIEDGVYAYLSAKTASDTPVFRNTQIIDGAVHFDVPATMTAEVGEIECELILHEEGNMILTSCGFDVIVFHSIGDEYADEAVVSEDYHAMVEATTAANNAAIRANEAADEAEEAAEYAKTAGNTANEIAATVQQKLDNGEFKGEKGEKGDDGDQVTLHDLSGNGGNLDLSVENNSIYYVSGYDTITVSVPESGHYTAHMFVTFPNTDTEVGFIMPEGIETYGDDHTIVKRAEKWEVNIDSVGGALFYRKQVQS